MKVPQGGDLIEIWDAPTDGTKLDIGPDGYVKNWVMTDGQASIQLWVHAKNGTAAGSGKIVLQTTNYDTLDTDHVEYTEDAINFATKLEQTIVIFLDERRGEGAQGGGSLSSPAQQILTKADWEAVLADRASYLSSLGEPTLPSTWTNYRLMESVVSQAEAERRVVDSKINAVLAMESDPNVTSAAYKPVLIEAIHAYDKYLHTLLKVELARPLFIGWGMSWSSAEVALMNRSHQLPSDFPALRLRGILQTESQGRALLKAGAATTQAFVNGGRNLDFTCGAMQTAAIGLVGGGLLAIGVVTVAGPVAVALGVSTGAAALMGGGAMLAGGIVYQQNVRATEGLSGSDALGRAVCDVTGYTNLQIAVHGRDPVTGRSVTAEQRGGAFGATISTIVLTATGLAGGGPPKSTTLTIPWRYQVQYATASSCVRTFGANATRTATVWGTKAIAVPVPTAQVGLGAATLGGVNIVYMAAREREPSRLRVVSESARQLGFTNRVRYGNYPFDSHGQPVFTDGRTFLSPDWDSHNGGVWKMFDRNGRRLGTYDANLNWIAP